MKRKLKRLFLPLLVLVGLALLLYPQLSDLWNRRTNSVALSGYSKTIREMSDKDYSDVFTAAREYNEELRQMGGYILSEEMQERYYSLLDVSGNGIMAYLEIPSISVTIPIYHGTEAGVLQVASGHIEWTSLPVGGVGTHCSVCGHRGLASSKLFTDLPKMETGDVFYVRVLDEYMTYEVDQILTVLPDELEYLDVVSDKDYFTLMTCTPYGINTHRLLVRGHRISNSAEGGKVYITSEATEIKPTVVAPIITIPFLLLMLLPSPKPKANRRKSKKQWRTGSKSS